MLAGFTVGSVCVVAFSFGLLGGLFGYWLVGVVLPLFGLATYCGLLIYSAWLQAVGLWVDCWVSMCWVFDY